MTGDDEKTKYKLRRNCTCETIYLYFGTTFEEYIDAIKQKYTGYQLRILQSKIADVTILSMDNARVNREKVLEKLSVILDFILEE